ncbi:MAG TPA: GNAT family N-acetyltransferase [Rubrivivax sp.]|nr:GNAT family N-acetyltransferase [Rubrivivax sp.]
MTMQWQWLRFRQLGLDDLYDALALRCQVFIVEQGPYQDPDGLDRHAWHLLGRDDTGRLQACLRVVDPGGKFAEPSIGRVAVEGAQRGQGLGRALVVEGIARCLSAWPGQGIRISAQAHLERFYASLGFETVGAPYDEDRIPHVEMLRPAP